MLMNTMCHESMAVVIEFYINSNILHRCRPSTRALYGILKPVIRTTNSQPLRADASMLLLVDGVLVVSIEDWW